MKRGALPLIAIAAAVLGAVPGIAAPGEPVTPELQAAYQAVLLNPADPAANLRYAQIAEQLGEVRKALTAYERMLVVDPSNRDAQVGMARIRRKLQPELTQVTLETGIVWQSNPRLVDNGMDDDFKSETSVMVRDERKLGDIRWRTIVNGALDYYFVDHDLNYEFGSVTTGPLFDVGPSLALNPFVGGGVAGFQNRYYYSEGTVGAQAEGTLNGAYQMGKLRVGYRDYGSSFTTRRGFFVDGTAKFSMPDLLGPGGLLVFTPTARWSGIEGDGLDANFDDVAPGQYTLYSAELGYYQRVFEAVTMGPSIRVGQTFYRTDVTLSGDKRTDLIVSPGFTVVFNGLFGGQRDLRLDYRFDWTNSNDPLHDSQDHVASVKVVNRF